MYASDESPKCCNSLQDMKRKQEECMPMLAALDALEAKIDSIESAITALDQQTSMLTDSI